MCVMCLSLNFYLFLILLNNRSSCFVFFKDWVEMTVKHLIISFKLLVTQWRFSLLSFLIAFFFHLTPSSQQKASSIKNNAARAVLYECIICVSGIFPCAGLLDKAAKVSLFFPSLFCAHFLFFFFLTPFPKAVADFLYSDNIDVKYMGLEGVKALVGVSVGYAEEHQMAVIDCLDSIDETIQVQKNKCLIHPPLTNSQP